MKKSLIGFALLAMTFSGMAQKKIVRINPPEQTQKEEIQVLKRKVAIARFSNETQYAKGIFYDKNNDPIGKQALDILSTKLSSTNKFILLERQDMDKILEEMKIGNIDSVRRVGADFLIVGSVTQFGRKNVGDVNAFSRSKTQTVQAGVSLRLVDVSSGMIIYSEEAFGEAETTNKTVMGLGQRTDYDATLSDKAISAAISKLVENIVNNCMDRPWKAYFLAHDANGIIISGGKSQGLKMGDVYDVVEKGKSVKNPQTGMMIELPGAQVGKIKISYVGGDNPQNEFSMVTFTEGGIDNMKLDNYFIKEVGK